MSNNSDVLVYFLISGLNPPQKIFELINSPNHDAYVQAHEIYNNYVNSSDDEEIKTKRIKVPMDNNFAFHIYITKEELIFISYSNTIYLSTELNFDLFEEINEYLKTDVNRKINEGQSFLIEEEKDEIKDIINYYIEEYSFIDSIDTIQTVNESENSNIKKEAKENEKQQELTIKKKDNSKGGLLKNTIVINNNKSIAKPKISIRQTLKMKHLSKTMKVDNNKLKNKIKTKLNEKNQEKKSNHYLEKKYGVIELTGNKPDLCTKVFITVILAIIIAIEILATILIIYYYDYSK